MRCTGHDRGHAGAVPYSGPRGAGAGGGPGSASLRGASRALQGERGAQKRQETSLRDILFSEARLLLYFQITSPVGQVPIQNVNIRSGIGSLRRRFTPDSRANAGRFPVDAAGVALLPQSGAHAHVSSPALCPLLPVFGADHQPGHNGDQ